MAYYRFAGLCSKAAVAAMLLAYPGAAAAQDVASDVGETAEAGNAGEIVVTAQRKAERLIDVPISITAASAEKLESAGVDSVRGLAQVTPGLLLLDAGQRLQPAIRGITSQGINAGEESNIATYVDDVYIASQSAGLFQLADTERVEVLKGPQGTLFGRNSTGGAIRIATRRPGADPVFEAKAKYGFRQNDKELSLYAAGPLSDQLAVSVAALLADKDGYITNLTPGWTGGKLGKARGITARGKLYFTPASNAEFIVALDIVDQKEQVPGIIPVIAGRSVYASRPGAIVPTEKFTTAYSQEPRVRYKGWGASLTSSLDFDDVTIKSITAYRRSEVPEATNDVDRTNLSIQSNAATAFYTNTFSQDVNLNYDSGGPLSFVTGIFYFQSRASVGLINYTGDIAPQNILSGRIGVVETKAFAGYGEATLDVSETVSVTGGLRYSHEKKYYDYRTILTATPTSFSAEDDWSNLSYRIVAQYKPSDNTKIYASYSTGFKAGVFNTSIAEANPVKPETVDAIEVGIKTRLAGRVFVTAAAFDYGYDDIQTTALIQDDRGTRTALTNAASAKIRGLELGLDAGAGPFDISAGLSWLPTAKYKSFRGAIVYYPLATGGNQIVNGVDISGTRMVRAPKFTGNLGVTYTAELGDAGKLQAAVNYAYNSGILFGQGETSPFAFQRSYSLVNGNIGFTTADDRYRFVLYAENIANKAYRTYIIQTANGDSGAFGRPREIGVRVEAKF